jgi:hypothetical protein
MQENDMIKGVQHLIDASTEELVNESINVDKVSEMDDPKLNEEYEFDFCWKDKRGHKWEGHFKNKILSIGEQQAVGILRSRLGGGIPIESLDLMTNELNLIIAHLSISLIVKPKWAEDLRSLKYIDLLQDLYKEVASHEAMFFGDVEFEENSSSGN